MGGGKSLLLSVSLVVVVAALLDDWLETELIGGVGFALLRSVESHGSRGLAVDGDDVAPSEVRRLSHMGVGADGGGMAAAAAAALFCTSIVGRTTSGDVTTASSGIGVTIG